MSLLVAAATPWAATLSFAGLVLLAAPLALPAPIREVPPTIRMPLGVLALASGQLVLTCLVADRLFPRASKALTWVTEILTCLVLFVALAFFAALAAGVYLGAAS